jgi:hypothetical protein
MEDHGESTERGQMVGGPLGDMVDVLSPRNLSAAALQRYAVLVLAGDVEEDRMRAALPSRLALVLCFTIVLGTPVRMAVARPDEHNWTALV